MKFQVLLLRGGVESAYGEYGEQSEAEAVAAVHRSTGYYSVRVAPVISDVGRLAVEAGA